MNSATSDKWSRGSELRRYTPFVVESKCCMTLCGCQEQKTEGFYRRLCRLSTGCNFVDHIEEDKSTIPIQYVRSLELCYSCFRKLPTLSEWLLVTNLLTVCGGGGECKAKVGGPQLSSANHKSANLQTYQICWICGPSANAAVCGCAIYEFAGLQFADPIFLANLILWLTH